MTMLLLHPIPQEHMGECGIIYARLRKTCDWLADQLNDAGGAFACRGPRSRAMGLPWQLLGDETETTGHAYFIHGCRCRNGQLPCGEDK